MLIDLSKRSNEEELMDDPNVTEEALNVALSDISRVNRLLGGTSITVKAVFNQIKKTPVVKKWVLIDLGCGDGEMLRYIAKHARKENISIQLIGIDTNDKCIVRARKMSVEYPEISYYTQDIFKLTKQDFNCDIIICTLTLHHFGDEGIKKVLKKSMELVSTAVIINDIHRNQMTYYLFKLFSFFFIQGYVAKNDGLVSIKRGFKREELVNFAKELQLKKYQLHWKWAFRYRWIIDI
ncbi:methyltransferase domain-containing protein [Aquimarina sp. RZ0]|nr:methyltransferase domain-containing protein [Aquimarina sp. RZ0]